MSHAWTRHPGDTDGLTWAIRVTKLCLGALFTVHGIPQLYYGTEVGLERWKNDQGDQDMRRDFPWQIMNDHNHPRAEFKKESEIFDWTKDLIQPILPSRVVNTINGAGLKHWKTGQSLKVEGDKIKTSVDAKTIDIYCR